MINNKVARNRSRDVGAEIIFHQCQCEIDPRGHSGRGPDRSISDKNPVVIYRDGRKTRPQIVMGFERAENEKQQKLSWRWQTRTEHGALMVLELLADAPEIAGGKVQPLPTEGTISAINIPHSSMVFDLHEVAEIEAELLGGEGIAIEKIKHANLVRQSGQLHLPECIRVRPTF